MSATTIKHSRVLSLVLAAALLSLAHGAGDAAKLSQLRRGRRLGSSSGKGKGNGGSTQGTLTNVATFQLDKQQHCAAGYTLSESVKFSPASGKAGKAGKAGSAGTSIKVNSEGGKGKAGKAGSAGTSIEVNSSGGKGKGGKAGSSSRRLSSGKGKGGKGGESQVDRVAEINIMVGRVNDSCGKCECNRNEPVEPVVVEVVYPTPPEPTKNPTSSPTELVFASDLPPRACASSHYSFPAGIYDPLGGWLYKITTDSTLSCDDTNIWDLGTDVDGAFDHLVLFRDGIEIMRWGTTCPVDYPVKDGDSLVFYSDNSHEYRGFRVCTDSMEPAAPEEGIIQGNCFVSHPTWDGYGTHYDNYYGYSFKIEKAGTMTSESFNIRGRGTGQALKLYRNNELIGKWNGDEGISNQDVEVGDVISFFVDDSAIYDENTGFKVCFMY